MQETQDISPLDVELSSDQNQQLLKSLAEFESSQLETVTPEGASEDENTKLSRALAESQQHAKQLQRVIQFLRERSEEVNLESKQFREEFQELQNTITTLNQQVLSSKSENDALRQQLYHEQQGRQEAVDEVHALQLQFESLKKSVMASRQQLNEAEAALKTERKAFESEKEGKDAQLVLMETEIATMKQTLMQGVRELHEIEQYVKDQKGGSRESEEALRIAQHNFANKKREAVLLTEQNEALGNEILELRTALSEAQARVSSLENKLAEVQEEVQRTQESKWEHLYLKSQETCHELERHVRELKVYEEKQLQAKALVNSLGLLFSTGETKKVTSHLVDQKAEFSLESDAPPLFQKPEHYVRYKQTLFD